MVIDTLDHADLYIPLLNGLREAFDFLRRPDLASLAEGRYELDGDRIYVLVQRYATQEPADGALEAHRLYADVQVVLSGAESMGYAPVPAERTIARPYDPARDVIFYGGPCDFVVLRPGSFALLLPQDGHMPGRHERGAPAPVRKAVAKIRLT